MLTYPMEERGALPLYEYLCRRIRAESAKMEHICQLQQEGGC